MSKVFIEDENKNILANTNEDPFIIDQVGTDVFVNGQRQDRLDFTSDPQEQLDELDKQVTDKTDLTTLASKVETNTRKLNKIVRFELDRNSSNNFDKSFMSIMNFYYPCDIKLNGTIIKNGFKGIAYIQFEWYGQSGYFYFNDIVKSINSIPITIEVTNSNIGCRLL